MVSKLFSVVLRSLLLCHQFVWFLSFVSFQGPQGFPSCAGCRLDEADADAEVAAASTSEHMIEVCVVVVNLLALCVSECKRDFVMSGMCFVFVLVFGFDKKFAIFQNFKFFLSFTWPL